MKHFYDLCELSNESIRELHVLANRLRVHPEPGALRGKVMSLVFLSPSLRTLSSFEAAMIRLGGGTFVISPDRISHGLLPENGIVMEGAAAEHFRDAMPVIDSYGDIMGVRMFAQRRRLADDLADKVYKSMAELVHKPLINMESAAQHPCQSLADWKTLDDHFGASKRAKLVLSWVYHPRALPLSGVISTSQMAAKRGLDVVVLRPDEFALPPAVLEKGRQLATENGGTFSETSDRNSALAGADIIYAREWSSTTAYGDSATETKLRSTLGDWCVTADWFRGAKDGCRLMHSMPVRRGVSISDEVLDSPRSLLTVQAENRMWTQMALLHRMLLG